MSLPLFTESATCQHMRTGREGLSCERCRSDIKFRARLQNGFTLPNDDINFDCPHGVPWPDGHHPTASAPADTRAAAERREQQARHRAEMAEAIMARLTPEQHGLVTARSAVCDQCEHKCRPLFADLVGCRKAGCAGVRLSDGDGACPAGKWTKLTAG